MKPTLETLQLLCPEIEEAFIRQHLERLETSYFKRFDLPQTGDHLRYLSTLSQASPVAVSFEDQAENSTIACTVYAFDYPYGFSLITGILAATGFSIRQGEAFTYAKAPAFQQPYSRRSNDSVPHKSAQDTALRRRRIIDHFIGIPDTNVPLEVWETDFTKELTAVLKMLEPNTHPEGLEAARQRVNERVVQRLASMRLSQSKVLYPITIEVENTPHFSKKGVTRLKIVSQDTPAFLYSLSTTLSLNGLSIEHVSIHTDGDLIEDIIDLVKSEDGQSLIENEAIDRLKLSVLLTKQFTHFLGYAPDPYNALNRFEYLINDILKKPESARWVERLSQPDTLAALAQLLGASDYVWEDFIRLQYENLLPLLPEKLSKTTQYSDPTTLAQRLQIALEKTAGFDACKRALNHFKDHELYLIDLDHILNPEIDFRIFAERLTLLAEEILKTTADIIYTALVQRYGKPRTIAGLEVPYSLVGLGKLGGAALGYASDIELLLIYSDNGNTDYKQNGTTNREFFSQFVRELTQFIEAKREGIFHIDLRLRPYGNSGPLACSLESFCRYYGPKGDAHAYEKLALVRLRSIGGSPELGAQVERLRDEYLYVARDLDLNALRELRAKQYAEKRRDNSPNAKFSPGALVDIEYAVQVLQVLHGGKTPTLRTPRIHEALKGLEYAGVLKTKTYRRLTQAYDFLRQLINGLRMLRGSALDLFLPPVDSDEFRHLARRIGYAQDSAPNTSPDSISKLDPARQLFIEFETRTAAIRTFIEQHFGRDALLPIEIGRLAGNVADLILASDPDTDPKPQREHNTIILKKYGFKQPQRAYHNLLQLAGVGPQRETFIKLAVLACDLLRREPDPDMALNNWERFIQALPDPAPHYLRMLSQPRQLHILLTIFARSQFLANTLIQKPEWFEWVAAPDPSLSSSDKKPSSSKLRRKQIEDELHAHLLPSRSSRSTPLISKDWLAKLRHFRKREMLRIGTHDMCLGYPLRRTITDLSVLAEALTQVALERIQQNLLEEGHSPFTSAASLQKSFCILAFGKLGGNELNYSSDIDLVGVFDLSQAPQGLSEQAAAPFFATLMEHLRSDLSTLTEDGYVYRIDYRLRPYGRAGALAYSLPNLADYYHKVAALWEIQALLKLRPIAGHLPLGDQLLSVLRPLLLKQYPQENIIASIQKMRAQAVAKSQPTTQGVQRTIDIKSGIGGIRDVEFLVQGLQLIHAHQHPAILTGNTLEALSKLQQASILSLTTTETLRESYSFLRRVEHYLQILDDRQNHTLPQDTQGYEALAKRVLGHQANGAELEERLQQYLRTVRTIYLSHLSA